jgi:hypothetical protein
LTRQVFKNIENEKAVISLGLLFSLLPNNLYHLLINIQRFHFLRCRFLPNKTIPLITKYFNSLTLMKKEGR